MKTLARESGQAMVETTILMLILIPLFLYAFFLCGVAFHRLEVQEAVVSSVWDFSQRNIEASGDGDRQGEADNDAAAVGGFNRMLYSDHTSAYDDPGDPFGNNEKHHVEFGVHACWLGHGANGGNTKGSDYDAPGSTEVTCDVQPSGDTDWMLASSGKNFAASPLNRGGLARCWAKAWVYNYLIPDKFTQFAHVDMNGGKTMRGNQATQGTPTGVHGIKGQGGTAANIFIRDRAAISYGTWGIMNGAPGSGGWKLTDADIGGASPGMFTFSENVVDSDNPFYKRVKFLWKSEQGTKLTYLAVEAAYGIYAAQAASKKVEIVADFSSDPNAGVLPTNAFAVLAPYLVARYKPGQNYSQVTRWAGNLESTPYTSYNNDRYVNAWNQRGPYYMGNKQPRK